MHNGAVQRAENRIPWNDYKEIPHEAYYEAIGKFKKHTGVRMFYIGVEYHISP